MLNNQIKLLDCTLRDGAYLIEKEFGNNNISGIINGLVQSAVDYIEIGFLQDSGFGDGKTVFRNSHETERFIPENKGNSIFTALADYSRYSIDNLDEYNGKGLDAIRECFFKAERFQAIEVCKEIQKKGYKVFIQPVDILGYSDRELLELIEIVNDLDPYCFSIVDTFGSMYFEDLHRIFEIVNHNLIFSCKLGFHSHNNMQLSNALSQEFTRIIYGKREGIIDCTLSGMGRGAGNTPTELIMQYLITKWECNYDIDAVLDLLDSYMDNIRSRCSWGYSTPYFVAGCYSSHVNNIQYLLDKCSIRSKDIRYILNRMDEKTRKRYNYDILENLYLELMKADIDDSSSLEELKKEINDRSVLILIPGYTLQEYEDTIINYINTNNPFVISVNMLYDRIKSDYVYISNKKRFSYWKDDVRFKSAKKILTSNFGIEDTNENTKRVSFMRLAKNGNQIIDNSTIMLLNLLINLEIDMVAIAGFDGYSESGKHNNYVDSGMEIQSVTDNPVKLNKEIEEMFDVFQKINKNMDIKFITPSRFDKKNG